MRPEPPRFTDGRENHVEIQSPAPESTIPDPWAEDSDARRFLQGPGTRRHELWRTFRIFRELLHGYRQLHFVGPCVTVFGSARFGEGHAWYELGREVGSLLARAGFTVMTGGGPGLMEAANRGAREVGGHSVGCNIRLPREQRPNPYLDRWVTFEHFFVRKVMLVKYSYAFVALPGGFGTLDETFEILTLVQTGKVHRFPVVLIGESYWAPLSAFVRERLVAEGTISPSDVELFRVTDSPRDAVERIRDVALDRFGLTYGPRVRPHASLGERALGRPDRT